MNSSNINFTAIDFETASEEKFSCCSLGLVVVKNGKINFAKEYLIQPPKNHFNNNNILIHKISPIETKDAPLFPAIWNEVKEYITNQLIVAHNIGFDKAILSETLNYYNISVPNFQIDCTFSIYGLGLHDCCKLHNIPLDHHYSLSDALACTLLYLKFLNRGIEISKSKTEDLSSNSSEFKYHVPIRKDLLKPDFESADSLSPFFKKKVVITGVFEHLSREEIAEILKEKGADINTSVSSKTNFLIAGRECGPSKYEKAINLNIPILTEDEFLSMIHES